jgi:hypothetical protein
MSLFHIRKLFDVKWDRKMTINGEERIWKKVVIYYPISGEDQNKIKIKILKIL